MNWLIEQIPEQTLWGQPLIRWIIAAGLGLAVAGLLFLIRWIGARIAKRQPRSAFLGRAEWGASTVARSLSRCCIVAAALLIGSFVIQLPEGSAQWRRAFGTMLVLIQSGVWLNAFLTESLRRYEDKHMAANAGKVTTLRALAFVGRIVIIIVVLLGVLESIPGFEVTTLITGLGIGGIAVALALQNVLGDLFASLSISLDRPFSIGDFIIVGDFLGTVEHIGLKTTRIRSLSGEQLVFSNTDLLQSRIRNYMRMQQRRVPFTVGVTYQTPPSKLRKIPDIFKKQLEPFDDVHFDRAHFKAYGAYSLDFEFVYYVHTSDYNRYMDIQQSINLGLYDEFEKEGIEFAYPTRTLFVENQPSAAPAE